MAVGLLMLSGSDSSDETEPLAAALAIAEGLHSLVEIERHSATTAAKIDALFAAMIKKR